MSARYDIAALGELLIDFTDSGVSDSGMRLFERNPGGAPANVLTAAARFGRATAFLGKVGDDMHGRFLRQTLLEAGIDVSGLVMAADVFTTLAFVALNGRGERSFSFARKPGADTCLRPEELNAAVLDDCRVLHVGSLSLTDEPACGATFAAVDRAKAAGAVISYDPNYRAALWPDAETAARHMRSMVPYVDVMKLSDEETALLTDEESSPEMEYLRTLVWEEVEKALGELPAAQRDVFELTEMEGFTFRELAEDTGIPVATLLSRKHYAVKHLRNRLAEVYEALLTE